MGRRMEGGVWSLRPCVLRRADKAFFRGDRIGLLEAIDRSGSITKAAREVGVSATRPPRCRRRHEQRRGKTAGRACGRRRRRDRAYRQRGRKRSGCTASCGTSIKGISNARGAAGDVGRFYSLVRRVAMRVSARNVFLGTVAAVRKGAVSTGGDPLPSRGAKPSARSSRTRAPGFWA